LKWTLDVAHSKKISVRWLNSFWKLFLGNSNFGPIEKRRKPTQLSTMTYLLEDSDILDDLKIINKNKAFTVSINIKQHLIFYEFEWSYVKIKFEWIHWRKLYLQRVKSFAFIK